MFATASMTPDFFTNGRQPGRLRDPPQRAPRLLQILVRFFLFVLIHRVSRPSILSTARLPGTPSPPPFPTLPFLHPCAWGVAWRSANSSPPLRVSHLTSPLSQAVSSFSLFGTLPVSSFFPQCHRRLFSICAQATLHAFLFFRSPPI